jgi:hypothetical protein
LSFLQKSAALRITGRDHEKPHKNMYGRNPFTIFKYVGFSYLLKIKENSRINQEHKAKNEVIKLLSDKSRTTNICTAISLKVSSLYHGF